MSKQTSVQQHALFAVGNVVGGFGQWKRVS